MRFVSFPACLVPLLVLLCSCALAPRMRAPLDPPRGRGVEMGAAVTGLLDATIAPGGGVSAWVQAALTEQLDLFAHAAALGRAVDGGYAGHHLDAALGLRLRQPILADTWIALEGAVQYEQRDLAPRELHPHLTFVSRAPIAQQFPGMPVWVYASPTAALSVRLYDDPVPFFPYTECPLGLLFRFDDSWALYVEGGLWQILGGGYAAVGAAVIF